MAGDTGFVLAEESALKAKLGGLTVTDRDSGRSQPVKVRFRWPDSERARVEYPLITIDFIGHRLTEYQHAGADVALNYVPDITPDDPGDTYPYLAAAPIPVELDYDVATHTRSARQDRELLGALLGTGRLPWRFGTLYVEADGRYRDLDLLGVRPAHYIDENRQQVFRTYYSLRTYTELVPHQITEVGQRVETVFIDDYDSTDYVGITT